jgi:hypothetical protein
MQTIRKTIQALLIFFLLISTLGFRSYNSNASPSKNEVWARRVDLGSEYRELLAAPLPPRHEFPAFCPGNCLQSTSNLIGQNYLYGVINNDGQHYADEWQQGVRATTFEFQWQLYEPHEGVFDNGYIQHMQNILSDLNAQGWFIQMIPGIQYTPQWVYDNYPDMYYVNQYGERYNPDASTQGSFRTINAPFNPAARQLIAAYFTRIFQDFDQSNPSLHFDAVRVGGGVQGELRYPPANWNGHTNSYWAFDPYAQDHSISGIPAQVIGWRPGIDENPGSVARGQLLINPGFEQSTPDFPIFGWTPDPDVTAIFTTTNPHSGDQSLQLGLTTPNRVHQFVRVEPNTTYQLQGWVRPGQAGSLARIFLSSYSLNNRPISARSFIKLESGASSWNQVSGEITTAVDTRFLKIELDGDQPGDFFFDDLQLTRLGETNTQSRDINVPLDFYDWYVKTLTNFQNWQIAELRKHFSGQLDVLYAGKGLLMGQLSDVLNNDLHGDSYTETGSGLYAGSLYERHIAGLPADPGISIFLTGVEGPSADKVADNSPYPIDWSAAHWLATLAHANGRPIWGENTGRNNPDQMRLTFTRMRVNGFTGIMWGFESELYANPNPSSYATIADYSGLIAAYSGKYNAFIPLCLR